MQVKHQGMIKCNITMAIKRDWEKERERAWGFYQVLEIITVLGTERLREASDMHIPGWAGESCSQAEKEGGGGWGVESCQDVGKKSTRNWGKFQVLHTNILLKDILPLHDDKLISMRAYQVIFFKCLKIPSQLFTRDLSTYATEEETFKKCWQQNYSGIERNIKIPQFAGVPEGGPRFEMESCKVSKLENINILQKE